MPSLNPVLLWHWQVLGIMPFPFSLELAALAARREYLNLEKWLQDTLASVGLPFVMAVLDFLDEKTRAGMDGLPPVNKIQLSPEVQALFFHFLSANSSALPLDAQEAFKRLQAKAAAGGAAGELAVGVGAAAPEGFASDIEEEANSYFQKIYGQQTGIDEMVGMLKRFKNSSVQREQEIFACMIHNLFDEYRFFPKYPEKELQITVGQAVWRPRPPPAGLLHHAWPCAALRPRRPPQAPRLQNVQLWPGGPRAVSQQLGAVDAVLSPHPADPSPPHLSARALRLH